MEDLGSCVTCLSWTHTSQECSLKEPKSPGSKTASARCQKNKGTEVCGRAHHKMLHGSNSAYAEADFGWGTPRRPGEFRPALFAGRPVGSLLTAGTAGAIFEIMKAPVLSVKGRRVLGIVFMDSGSNMNFITHDLAQQLMLEGASAQIRLKVVDKDYTEKEVQVHRVGVEDNTGKVHWMEAVGVDSITESAPLGDEAAARRAFPGIREGEVKRPVGAAGLLISMTERELHSQGGIEKGKLRLSKTPLGCGQVLTGVAETVKGATRGERLRAEGRAPQGETAA